MGPVTYIHPNIQNQGVSLNVYYTCGQTQPRVIDVTPKKELCGILYRFLSSELQSQICIHVNGQTQKKSKWVENIEKIRQPLTKNYLKGFANSNLSIIPLKICINTLYSKNTYSTQQPTYNSVTYVKNRYLTLQCKRNWNKCELFVVLSAADSISYRKFKNQVA